MAVIGTPLSTWHFCLLSSDGATYSYYSLEIKYVVWFYKVGRYGCFVLENK